MELRIGDYVRTKDGIERITDIKEWVNFQGYEKIITTDKNQYETLYEQNKIVKSSPNIIDLIEEGDYVNGERIQFITNKKELLTDGGYDLLKKYEEIKSIVTKEQFESMEYKVKE